MSDYFDDDSTFMPPRKRQTFVKEVRASSLTDALVRLDDWAKSNYDMFLISCETYDDDFVKLIIVGIENEVTRERYDC